MNAPCNACSCCFASKSRGAAAFNSCARMVTRQAWAASDGRGAKKLAAAAEVIACQGGWMFISGQGGR